MLANVVQPKIFFFFCPFFIRAFNYLGDGIVHRSFRMMNSDDDTPIKHDEVCLNKEHEQAITDISKIPCNTIADVRNLIL